MSSDFSPSETHLEGFASGLTPPVRLAEREQLAHLQASRLAPTRSTFARKIGFWPPAASSRIRRNSSGSCTLSMAMRG